MINTKNFAPDELIKLVPNFTSHYADVNGVKLHYVMGGQGEPLILIPGYPETWWAYHKVMPLLATKFHVIVVEMRGMGNSDKPTDGYEKKNMAKDIFELVKKLDFEKVYVGGHDIGAHVAFSFAMNYPETVSKLIMLDTPHPDTGMYHLPMLPVLGADYLYPWWLAFNQVKELPEQLLEGRMDIVIEWLFKNLLKDQKSISDFDKSVYTAAYNDKNAIRASNAWYQAFPKDIEDSKTYDKLTIPVIGIGGSGYEILQMALPNSTTNLQLKKIEDSGHFILSEKPNETAELMMNFLMK
ncbi:alpha/beta fold hydrolase [Chryseobacterium sp. JK1]|uniref:alpha/beta fold hydrolase n=1 Tax=Chryseobacterium sp. JK1 TaxID=874294 RepID=UPI003D6913A9